MTNVFRSGGIAAGGAVLLAAVLGIASPAYAADDLRDRYLGTRLALCDTSACYYVWGALDSDADGVSNADEAAAGTDPYDAASHPGLPTLKEIATARDLPSFEAGMGAFVLVPDEILAFREKAGLKIDDAAFPMPARGDSLARMGISSSLLKEFGIDPGHSGLTIGLGSGRDKAGLPGITAGAVDMSIVDGSRIGSAANGLFGRGGVKSRYDNWDNTVRTTEYHDGSRSETSKSETKAGGVHTDWFDSEGDLTQQDETVSGTTVHADGSIDIHSETRSTDGDGNRAGTTVTDTHVSPDGSSMTNTVSTSVNWGDDDKVHGTTKTITTTSTDAKGNSSSVETTEVCDNKGGNCTAPSSDAGDYPEDDGGTATGHWNPDADPPAVVTQEDVEGALAVRGAAVTTVAGWTPPGLGGEPRTLHDPSVIALVDETTAGASFAVVDPFRVTRAQPEVRPGMPDPILGPVRNPGQCNGLC